MSEVILEHSEMRLSLNFDYINLQNNKQGIKG